MASDYDKGTVTAREKLAAQRQNALAKYNAQSLNAQLTNQLKNYDLADKQNLSLRNTQLIQNRRNAETDRFEAQRQLQNAALGLMGSMNQAMNGSSTGNLMRMLEDREDSDNNIQWDQLRRNDDSVYNAYQESLNQNNASRFDAIANARKGLRDIQSDLAANLNNINPNLYKAAGSNADVSKIQKELEKKQGTVKANNAYLSGYITNPSRYPGISTRNKLTTPSSTSSKKKIDYFDQLINSFNRR